MPEKDQKERLLQGERAITPSSDEAIQATIDQLTSELEGVSNPPVVLEGESLLPRSLISEENIEIDLTKRPPRVDAELTHKDSALGNLIYLRRQAKLKRAA